MAAQGVNIHLKALAGSSASVTASLRDTEAQSKLLSDEAARVRDLEASSWTASAADKPFVSAYTPYTAGPTNLEGIQKGLK